MSFQPKMIRKIPKSTKLFDGFKDKTFLLKTLDSSEFQMASEYEVVSCNSIEWPSTFLWKFQGSVVQFARLDYWIWEPKAFRYPLSNRDVKVRLDYLKADRSIKRKIHYFYDRKADTSKIAVSYKSAHVLDSGSMMEIKQKATRHGNLKKEKASIRRKRRKLTREDQTYWKTALLSELLADVLDPKMKEILSTYADSSDEDDETDEESTDVYQDEFFDTSDEEDDDDVVPDELFDMGFLANLRSIPHVMEDTVEDDQDIEGFAVEKFREDVVDISDDDYVEMIGYDGIPSQMSTIQTTRSDDTGYWSNPRNVDQNTLVSTRVTSQQCRDQYASRVDTDC
jgi:hypothetical protein